MKVLISILLLVLPGFGFANTCEPHLTEQIVLSAAHSIEAINGGGNPLTTEIYSYSSRKNTWAIIFSYSGVQSVWNVKTTSDGCRVEQVSR